MNAALLGLCEHVCDIVPFLLSLIVGEHCEKVEHHAVIEWIVQESPGSFFTALEVCLGVICGLFVDNLVPHILCIDWQKVHIELEHVCGGLFSLGIGLVCGFLGMFDLTGVQLTGPGSVGLALVVVTLDFLVDFLEVLASPLVESLSLAS